MIFLFEIPSIQDDTKIANLIGNSENYQKQFSFLSETQELRNNFKKMVNFKSFELIQLGDSLIQYQSYLESYLKTNVDMVFKIKF